MASIWPYLFTPWDKAKVAHGAASGLHRRLPPAICFTEGQGPPLALLPTLNQPYVGRTVSGNVTYGVETSPLRIAVSTLRIVVSPLGVEVVAPPSRIRAPGRLMCLAGTRKRRLSTPSALTEHIVRVDGSEADRKLRIH